MSDLPYRRFLAYDALGVALWATAYVGLSVGAAAGWQHVRDELGAQWAAALIGLGLLVWVSLKTRRAVIERRSRASMSAESQE
jgi:membrane protein DedA with SNARE-associated domain